MKIFPQALSLGLPRPIPASPQRIRTALTTFTACLLLPSLASAQLDPTNSKKTPNIMLVLDTSGSMERVAGDEAFPSCDPGNPAHAEAFASDPIDTGRSRWISLQEILTGRILDYSCHPLNRSSALFRSLYSYNGAGVVLPPDADYRNPHHRAVSGNCVISPDWASWISIASGASGLTGNAFNGGAPFANQSYTGTGNCAGTFQQSPTGLLDALGEEVRFGLMTFDTLPDASQGYNSSTLQVDVANYSNGVTGGWSYIAEGTTPHTGELVNCPTPQIFEVGVRNGAAPPWEGRLIPFGKPDETATASVNRNDEIQSTILSTRPFGATPIAGALQDVEDFFHRETLKDPLDPAATEDYGPKDDPYVADGCRDQYVILLTDGEPNLDMRPHCQYTDPSGDGRCPFETAPEIASTLEQHATAPVKTFVVGFTKSTYGADQKCSDLTVSDWGSGGICSTTTDEDLLTCCKLHEIAYEGGTEHAYFADSAAELKEELTGLISATISGTASATQPVRSPGSGSQDSNAAYRILTSYTRTNGPGLWKGNIERQRWSCDNGVATLESKEPAQGDDYTALVNRNPNSRKIMTFVPVGTPALPRATLRPGFGGQNDANDGLGTIIQGKTVYNSAANFKIDASMFAENTDACQSPADCANLLVPWMFQTGALPCSSSNPSDCPKARCETPGPDCSLVGGVIHSTPVFLNRPNAAVADETYQSYRREHAGRPMVFLTSTDDGVFHIFKLSTNDENDTLIDSESAQPEMLAFIPPANVANLPDMFPNTRQFLLDGPAIVEDVIATQTSMTGDYQYSFERSISAARSPEISDTRKAGRHTWRTAMVQGFGGENSGFFAMDLSDLEDAYVQDDTGPRFLWQLTLESDNSTPIFGTNSKPLITTLYFKDTLTGAPKEVAVAILPGGDGAAPTGVTNRTCTGASTCPGS
ncbi:MAG: hypothetical protein MK135_14015, partial [Polyangiaceae bacterium]|nr:hypothetical protein [Polyangiaceae bacterium]